MLSWLLLFYITFDFFFMSVELKEGEGAKQIAWKYLLQLLQGSRSRRKFVNYLYHLYLLNHNIFQPSKLCPKLKTLNGEIDAGWCLNCELSR